MKKWITNLDEPYRGFAALFLFLGVLWIVATLPTLGTAGSHLSWNRNDLHVLDMWEDRSEKWQVYSRGFLRSGSAEYLDEFLRRKAMPEARFRVGWIDDRQEHGEIHVRKSGTLSLASLEWYRVVDPGLGQFEPIPLSEVPRPVLNAVLDTVDEIYSTWRFEGRPVDETDPERTMWSHVETEFRWKPLAAISLVSAIMLLISGIIATIGHRRGQIERTK